MPEPSAIADDPAARHLADVVLPDDEGKPHRLGDAWRDRPVVLAFLRHFG